MPINPDKYVIVRVWKAKTPSTAGHASLEIVTPDKDGLYISLWPDKQVGFWDLFRRFRTAHIFHDGLSRDIRGEEGAPELTIGLYNLNVEAIRAAYQKEGNELGGWQLARGTWSSPKSGHHSCVSFVYALLYAGGLRPSVGASLIGRAHLAIGSIAHTPAEIASIVLRAKSSELTDHPETRDYTFPGQTIVNPEIGNQHVAIIRIWNHQSQIGKIQKPKHASLEIKISGEDVFYVSPRLNQSAALSCGLLRRHYFTNTLAEDIRFEGEKPFTRILYSLDIRAIKRKYAEEREKLGLNRFWQFLRSQPIAEYDCFTFLHTLLDSGGIYKLLIEDLSRSEITKLGREPLPLIAEKAKRTELIKYPETMRYPDNVCETVAILPSRAVAGSSWVGFIYSGSASSSAATAKTKQIIERTIKSKVGSDEDISSKRGSLVSSSSSGRASRRLFKS